MISWLFELFFNFRKALKTKDTVRQLAYGVAFGMVLGLIPKGNLIAILIPVVVFSFRVNLGTAMLAAISFSFLAMTLDPFSHRVGVMFLKAPALASFWTAIYQWPLVPWTKINNTVVLGNLVLGFVSFYPTYRISLSFFAWQEQLRANRLQKAADDTPHEQSAADVTPAKAETLTSIEQPSVTEQMAALKATSISKPPIRPRRRATKRASAPTETAAAAKLRIPSFDITGAQPPNAVDTKLSGPPTASNNSKNTAA